MTIASHIDGWIIAGGESRRMGLDKAALEIGGRSLIEMAGNALSKIPVDRISIAGGSRVLAREWTAFPDNEAPGLGPISGLITALSNGASEWIAVISCDMPFVTGEVFTILANYATAHDAAVVPIQPDGRPQPLCALYRREPVLSAVRELVDTDDRSMRNLLSKVATHFVEFTAFRDLQNSDHLFLNINSPHDYEMAKSIFINSQW